MAKLGENSENKQVIYIDPNMLKLERTISREELYDKILNTLIWHRNKLIFENNKNFRYKFKKE